MPDRTPPSTRCYSPYSPPLTRSRSSGSDQVAPALSSSPGPDFPGPDWPVRCRASNVEGESLFELLYKAHSSGNHASRADLVKQMNEIVKEVDEFFNTLKQQYPWLENDLKSFAQLEEGQLAFNCRLDKIEEAVAVVFKAGEFQERLDQKYPWLGATLTGLKEIGAEEAVNTFLNSAVEQSQGGEVEPGENEDVAGTEKESATGEDKASPVAESTELGDSELDSLLGRHVDSYEDEYSRMEFINELEALRQARRMDRSSVNRMSISGSSLQYPAADYDQWAKDTPVDCVQWALEAEAQGAKYMTSLHLKQNTTIYLHPNFAINKNRWTYVPVGATLEDANESAIGDVLFMPLGPFTVPRELRPLSSILRTPFQYWVCAPDDEFPVLNKWAPFELGDSHPLTCNFVLQHFYGQAPFWVHRGSQH